MEHLARLLLHAVLRGIEQIAMALAKGVVHLHHEWRAGYRPLRWQYQKLTGLKV